MGIKHCYFTPPLPVDDYILKSYILGGSLGRFVQRKLAEEDLWTGHYGSVKESLRSAVAICERWVGVCETLTTQFWKNFRAHPWKGDRYIPDNLKKLATRLEEVLIYYQTSDCTLY